MKNSFKNLSSQELKAKREELKKKHMEVRFKLVIGHVDNPLQKRTMRRQIARLNTLIRAHEKAAELTTSSKSEVSSVQNTGAK
jgi:large subunit ribosomal protein L29